MQGATEGIFRMSGIILYKSKYGATRKYEGPDTLQNVTEGGGKKESGGI